MAVRPLGTALTCVALACALAGALPTYPLLGVITPSEPLHLVGVLGTGASTSHEYAYLRWQALADTEETLLQADQVFVQVFRSVGVSPGERGADTNQPSPGEPLVYEGVTLRLVGEVGSPQVLARILNSAKGDVRLNSTGLACDVSPVDAPAPLRFPDDSRQVSEPREFPFVEGGRLRAECRTANVTGENLDEVYFYGMEVEIVSTRPTQRIKTGTYEEPAAGPGSPNVTVTQTLRISKRPGNLVAEFPSNATATLYANRMLAVGDLSVGPSTGDLVWGALNATGSLDPFSATGDFEMIWRPPGQIVLNGTTLDGPKAESAPGDSGTLDVPAPLAAIGAAMAGLAVLAILGWFLFSKIAPERALDHPRRAQILEIVRSDPGIQTNGVCRTLGVPWMIGSYHVRRLVQAGHLVLHRAGGRTALFPAKSGFRGYETAVAMLRQPSMRRIYDALVARPGMDQAAIAAGVGLTRQRVSQALGNLGRARLVRTVRESGRLRYYAESGATAETPTSA